MGNVMKRSISMLLALVLLVGSFSGCGADEPQTAAPAEEAGSLKLTALTDSSDQTEKSSNATIGSHDPINRIFCVEDYDTRTNSIYVSGMIVNEYGNKLLGATVYLYDKDKDPVLDENGEHYCVTTNLHGIFTFRLDMDRYLLRFQDGRLLFYVTATMPGFYSLPLSEVVYINTWVFKQQYQEKIERTYIPMAEEISKNLAPERVAALYEAGYSIAEEEGILAEFLREYDLAELTDNKEAIEANVNKLKNINWGKFWKEAEDESEISFWEAIGLWYQSMPLRVRNALATGPSYHPGFTLEDDVPGYGNYEELPPLMEDEEFWNFVSALGEEVAIWVAMDLAGQELLHFARMYNLFSKVVKTYRVVASVGGQRVTLELTEAELRSALYLQESTAKVIDDTIDVLQLSDDGLKILDDIAKKLNLSERTDAATVKRTFLESIDERIAANKTFADDIVKQAEKAKAAKLQALEAERAAALEQIEALEAQVETTVANARNAAPDNVVGDAIRGTKTWDEAREAAVPSKDLIAEGEEAWMYYLSNHENGHALTHALFNYRAFRIRKATLVEDADSYGKIWVSPQFRNNITGLNGQITTYNISNEQYGELIAKEIGAVVSEDVMMGRISEGAFKDFKKAHKYATELADKMAKDKRIFLSSSEINQIADAAVSEYYGRLRPVFTEFKEKGVFDELAQILAKNPRQTVDGKPCTDLMAELLRKPSRTIEEEEYIAYVAELLKDPVRTINGSTYQYLIAQILEQKGLSHYIGDEWTSCKAIEDLIGTHVERAALKKKVSSLDSTIKKTEEAAALTAEDSAKLSAISESNAELQRIRESVSGWDLSLGDKTTIQTLLAVLKEPYSLYAGVYYPAVAFFQMVDAIEDNQGQLTMYHLKYQTAAVEGIVIDARTKKPIENVRIDAYYTGDNAVIGSRSGTKVNTTTSEEGGSFTVRDLPVGAYGEEFGFGLYFTAEGYQEKAHAINFNQSQVYRMPTPVELVPIGGGSVENPDPGKQDDTDPREDEDGTDTLPPGIPDDKDDTGDETGTGGNETDHEDELDDTKLRGTLTGRVVSKEDNTPIAGARVIIEANGGAAVAAANVNTDENGYFDVVLREGTYQITASAEGFVEGQLAGLNVRGEVTTDAGTLALEKHLRLTGTVFDEDQKTISAAQIRIFRDGKQVKCIYSQADGTYSTDLPPGFYDMKVAKDGYEEETVSISLFVPKSVDVTLEATTTIVRGGIYAPNGEQVTDHPVIRIRVPGQDEPIYLAPGQSVRIPQSDGHYGMAELEWLDDGSYWISLTGCESGKYEVHAISASYAPGGTEFGVDEQGNVTSRGNNLNFGTDIVDILLPPYDDTVEDDPEDPKDPDDDPDNEDDPALDPEKDPTKKKLYRVEVRTGTYRSEIITVKMIATARNLVDINDPEYKKPYRFTATDGGQSFEWESFIPEDTYDIKLELYDVNGKLLGTSTTATITLGSHCSDYISSVLFACDSNGNLTGEFKIVY